MYIPLETVKYVREVVILFIYVVPDNLSWRGYKLLSIAFVYM